MAQLVNLFKLTEECDILMDTDIDKERFNKLVKNMHKLHDTITDYFLIYRRNIQRGGDVTNIRYILKIRQFLRSKRKFYWLYNDIPDNWIVEYQKKVNMCRDMRIDPIYLLVYSVKYPRDLGFSRILMYVGRDNIKSKILQHHRKKLHEYLKTYIDKKVDIINDAEILMSRKRLFEDTLSSEFHHDSINIDNIKFEEMVDIKSYVRDFPYPYEDIFSGRVIKDISNYYRFSSVVSCLYVKRYVEPMDINDIIPDIPDIQVDDDEHKEDDEEEHEDTLANDGDECIICLVNAKNTCLQCGHIYCWECAHKINKCSICDKKIVNIIYMYNK